MNEISPIPNTQEFQTMKELGTMAIQSKLIPSSISTPEQAIIIMLKGRELGIPPMQAFSSIAVVNGKPTMSSELMLSMIYKNIPGAVVNFLETTVSTCIIEAKRPHGKPAKFEFNIEDAKKAGLTSKGPWMSYPAAMLRARCISAMARAMFPDALNGVSYTAEELGAETIEVEGVVISEPLKKEPPIVESKPIPVVSKKEAEPQNTEPKFNNFSLLQEVRQKSGWTMDQFREYAKKKYNASSSAKLSPEQIQEFIETMKSGTAELAHARMGTMDAKLKFDANFDQQTLK
jgi:hypothetical protein